MALSVNTSPTVRINPFGEPTQSFHLGLIYTPIHHVEIGGNLSFISDDSLDQYLQPNFSIKYRIPQFTPGSPILSVGISDLASDNNNFGNVYFVGAKDFTLKGMEFLFEAGAIFQSEKFEEDSTTQKIQDEFAVRSFVNLSITLNNLQLLLENNKTDHGLEYSQLLHWKPFQSTENSVNATSIFLGYTTGESYAKNFRKFWGGIQFVQNLHLENPDITKLKDKANYIEPHIWWQLEPHTHVHLQNKINYIASIKNNISIDMGIPGIYWVNSFDFSLLSKKTSDAKVQNPFWSQSYFQFIINKIQYSNYHIFDHPIFALGHLDHGHPGAMWLQRGNFLSWRFYENQLGVFYNDDGKVEAFEHIKLPVHPKFSGIFSGSQLYFEGGLVKDNTLAADLNYTHYLPFGNIVFKGGIRNTDIVMELNLQFYLGKVFQQNWSGIHFSLLPRYNINTRYELNTSTLEINNKESFYKLPWQANFIEANQNIDSTKFDYVIYCTRNKIQNCIAKDSDDDGFQDYEDNCPNEPEDFDQFQDLDGCPEKDNDKDHIFDDKDLCPNEPEDFDGYQDQDGCPELDNDGDKIVDTEDNCIFDAEDFDLFEDEDGCPDKDNDKDNIIDLKDICPMQPEDYDNYQDQDGCPDHVDYDDIPEKIDNCPETSEDFDGYEDEDGCPDYDNDSDGIPDKKDKCPNDFEVFNDFRDEDGCPD